MTRWKEALRGHAGGSLSYWPRSCHLTHRYLWASTSGLELCCQMPFIDNTSLLLHTFSPTELPAADRPVRGWTTGGGERDEERWRAGQKQDKVYVDICEHTSRTRGAELLQHNLSGSQVIWQPVIFFWSAGARCWKQRRFRVDFSSCHTCKFLHSSSTFDLRSVCVCVCLWLAVWKCILLSTLVDLSWTREGICRHAVSALSCIYHGESSVVAMVMRPLLAYIRFFYYISGVYKKVLVF